MKKDLSNILTKDQINGEELASLILSRNKKSVNFILIDVREQDEYDTTRIAGVDYLLPTSVFSERMSVLEKSKDDIIIVQCRSGIRSYHVQQNLRSRGYKNVINLSGGIIEYPGRVIRKSY